MPFYIKNVFTILTEIRIDMRNVGCENKLETLKNK